MSAQSGAYPPPPLEGGQRTLATIAVSLAMFMNVLDTTIANVSIPAISGDVGVSPTQGTWVITSFAVANAISVPLTGWLAQRFGQVRLFVASVLLFVAASLMCGLSSSLQMLIFFRVIQGAVAGPMIPLSQALLLQSYPKEKAPMALAAWSMTTLVAPVMGPILGGWLTDNLTWPWIFYINIPVGLAAAWMTWLLLKERESPTHKKPIDTVGLALLVVWVGSLQIVLDKGRELDWFNSPEILFLMAAAVVGFCFFLAWELTDEHPVVDLRLFAERNFSLGTLTLALGYAVFFGNVVLMPLWLQQYMGYTATWAGLVTAPIGFLAILLTPVVGKIMPRVDHRALATSAFLVFAAVFFMRAGFTAGADVSAIVLPQLIQGAGAATFFIPLMAIILSGIPHHKIPSASGLTNFARITAGAFGASISTTWWDHRASHHHAQMVDGLNAYNPVVTQGLHDMGQLGLDQGQALQLLNRVVDVQAYTLGADDLFWGGGVLMLGLVVLVWFTRPERGGSSDGGGAH